MERVPSAAGFASVAAQDREARLGRIGDRIAELAARIQAATYEMLVHLRELDALEGWKGFGSTAEWLAWRTGYSPGVAREYVRVARALGPLPKLSEAMRRGQISYSKVRAVTRVATPECEEKLLGVALAGTAAHVEQIVRAWRRIDQNAEQTEERRRHESRSLTTFVDHDGMVVVRGRLTPEVGAVLRRALEAACDQARRAPSADDVATGRVAEDAATGAALDGGATAVTGATLDGAGVEGALSSGVASVAPDEVMAPTLGQRQADAIGAIAEAALAGGLDRGTAGDRYQVVLHVDAPALAEGRDVPAGTPGRAMLPVAAAANDGSAGTNEAAERAASGGRVPAGTSGAAAGGGTNEVAEPGGGQTVLDEGGGIHVSAETARRLACDTATVTIQHGPDGSVLDVGRRTRTISPALRRALAARDRRCRFPGCGNRRCDAHHVRHWADGGRTALDNLVLLCRRHHRTVHEEGYRITLDAAGGVQFHEPDGRLRPEAPPAPTWTGPALQPVNDRLAAAGIEIDAATATPAWRGERLDLGYAMSVLWQPRAESRQADPPRGD